MKKLFILPLLIGLFPSLPATANPAVTACYNSLIERPEMRPDSARIMVSVDHQGSQYHLIQETSNQPRQPDSRTYIRTDANGGCEELMSYQLGSFPAVSVYQEKLGWSVFEKIRATARSQVR